MFVHGIFTHAFNSTRVLLPISVMTVKHPRDALCTLRIKGVSFDLVVADVHMPDMNGFELQQQINHEFNLPVVCESRFNWI